jgi:hypothetical protein
MLEAVDLSDLISVPDAERSCSICGEYEAAESESLWSEHVCPPGFGPHKIDWVICGGESGPGARPFHGHWAAQLLHQCRAAGVPFFMKQFGSNAWNTWSAGDDTITLPPSQKFLMRDRKGGDPAEWPEHLRVREWPR